MKLRLLLAPVVLFAFASSAVTNKVLIIGIDGTMCSALAVARTPNLDALKSGGCFTVRAVTHPVTHSAACWTSMFTGVWGDKHLVNDPGNSFAGNNLTKYPSFFKYLEAANPSLNTLCFARWSPLVTVVPDADVKLAFNTDAEITAETCRRLTNSNPDVFYMILLDVDSAGHTYGWGPGVTNYVQAIETADGRVGQIVSALHSRPTYTNEDWLVIALTDHGEHDNPDLEKSRITWHIVSGPSAARGVMWPSPSIVDVAATVLTHMHVPILPEWNLDARVEGMPLPVPALGTNLIFNPGAEVSSGTAYYNTNRGIAWWFDTSSTTLGTYGANTAFPGLSSPGPVDRGSNFFLGGTANGVITQRIDISGWGLEIEGVGLNFTLSGWFGGAGVESDAASLTANFLDQAGLLIASNTVGNVTASDRTNTTGLFYREVEGSVPAGTRFVEFVVSARVVAGSNDGSADNLGFVLRQKPGLPLTISIQTFAPDSISFLLAPISATYAYTLQSSSNLVDWGDVTTPIQGTGATTTVSLTNPPPAPAFYRAVSR